MAFTSNNKALFIHLQFQEIWEKIFVYQHRGFPNMFVNRAGNDDVFLK